ncbi:MAG TPA: glycyl-radical enzyme activating protein [Victivallales bacterium]|nr:glycyl-radical enzyme activating protein [Victivallales bacterium]
MKYNKTSGNISMIQRYSTKDGPGIRSTVFFKGCHMNCIWCSNPELINPYPELMEYKEKCRHCNDKNCIKEKSDKLSDIATNKWSSTPDLCKNSVFEKVGGFIDADELLTELLKDIVFYDTSGGGVTFSGGEPALQGDFICKVAKKLKRQNIHLTLDTSGFVPWKNLEKILPYFDLVLYDIKIFNRELHKKFTGVDNKLVLKNAEKISELNIPMDIRMVIVPEYTDSHKDIDMRFNFIKKLRSVKQVDILNFHQYGAKKYTCLNREYKLRHLTPLTEAEIERIKNSAISHDIKITIGG